MKGTLQKAILAVMAHEDLHPGVTGQLLTPNVSQVPEMPTRQCQESLVGKCSSFK
jgi:hypothetical protein